MKELSSSCEAKEEKGQQKIAASASFSGETGSGSVSGDVGGGGVGGDVGGGGEGGDGDIGERRGGLAATQTTVALDPLDIDQVKGRMLTMAGLFDIWSGDEVRM